MMGRQQLLLRPTVHETPAGTARETSAETGKQGMLPSHRPSLKQSQGRWQRLMHTTKLFSMREAQQPFKPALKYLQEQIVLRLWTLQLDNGQIYLPEMAIVVRKG